MSEYLAFMKSVEQVMIELESMADPEYISKMEYFGIKKGTSAYGIKHAVLKPLAKEIGKSQELANELWNQPVHEAKLMAIHLSEPKKFAEETAEKWTSECYSWDMVDGIGMKILPKTEFVYFKIDEWSFREPEYEKRMAFAAMVGVSMHQKKTPDTRIAEFFPTIEREAWDDRNFVKKAVNWSLRQIGKRSLELNKQAIEVAKRIKSQDTKAARWIANDALRELRSDKIQERLIKK
ncbi:MAG: DNA alkylation repair protein [Ekhidna sp.]